MRKFIALMLICLFVLLPNSGCYDANESENMAYVLTIGIDEGVADKWRITVQFNKMQQISGAGGSGGSNIQPQGSSPDEKAGYTTVTVDSPSFYAGINMIDAVIPRRINFMHTKYVIFSEKVAKSGELNKILTPLIRFRQMRRTMRVIVSKEQAMELIKNNEPFIGTYVSKSMELLLYEQSLTNFTPTVTLNDFYNSMKSPIGEAIAIFAAINDFKKFKYSGKRKVQKVKTGGEYYAGEIPRQGGLKTEYFGCAAFDGDKMIAKLNGDETRTMIIVRGQLRRSFFVIKDPLKPDSIVPIDLREDKKPKININTKGKNPAINLKIYLKGELLAVQSNLNYERGKLKSIVEKAVAKAIKGDIDKLMKKCTQKGLDIFMFGEAAAKNFGTIGELNKYNWLKKFKHARINTKVDFIITRSGTLIQSKPIYYLEGSKK